MVLTGVFINSIGVFLAGLIGSLCKRGIPEKVRSALMTGLGLCVLYIGISGITAGSSIIILILSLSLGAAAGTLIDIDGKLLGLGGVIQRKLALLGRSEFAEGFVAATLFVCAGAMSIVGSIESGTQGTYETLIAKTMVDGAVIFVMASTKGIGCSFSGVVALVSQTILTLSAGFIADFLSNVVIADMAQIGAILIVGIALNLLRVTDIKIGNLILSIFMPPLLHGIIDLAQGLLR